MSKTNKFNDYIKANRRGSRDAELENKTGFTAVDKTHKSKKQYNRKEKFKKDLLSDDTNDEI
jgi:hypothetical protein